MLDSNQFSGTLPAEIGNCSALTVLSLSNNNLTGQIPRELCDAGSHTQVNLNGNNLSGSVDDVFSKCTNLTELDLEDNQITGFIPEYLGSFLLILRIDNKSLKGPIPVSIWRSSLMEFSAANNMLCWRAIFL